MGGGVDNDNNATGRNGKTKTLCDRPLFIEFSISPCTRRILKINNQLGAHGNNENFRVASSDVCLY